MYDLIEIFFGNVTIIDFNLSWADCQLEAIRQTYISDGMALFVCETGA